MNQLHTFFTKADFHHENGCNQHQSFTATNHLPRVAANPYLFALSLAAYLTANTIHISTPKCASNHYNVTFIDRTAASAVYNRYGFALPLAISTGLWFCGPRDRTSGSLAQLVDRRGGGKRIGILVREVYYLWSSTCNSWVVRKLLSLIVGAKDAECAPTGIEDALAPRCNRIPHT